MKQVYYVVVFILRRHNGNNQLLMARRAENKYMGGTWQLISGGLEPDETAWQGALREMWEETRLKPLEFYRLSTLASFYRPDNDSLNTAPMFCAVIDNDAAVTINSEHTEIEWVNVTEADSRLMWPSDQQGLAEVRSVILNDGLAKGYMRIPL
ncbi:NUDIX hydrolase [Schlesneria paludicola]|uniref:NUDIX hydrolase n=1 Tax=Schlesneria paludicola TaxID=360056 RepID=UPI000299DBAA|nr:NUDIX domain-containing protein [Schlesneria paludicola]